MKKTLVSFFLLNFLFLFFACNNSGEGSNKTNASDSLSADDEFSSLNYNYAETDSLLWEISGNGLKKSSYLFGTVHLIPKDDFFVSKEMIKKFTESEQLVLEIDMGGLNPMSMINSSGISLPEGVSLKTLLSVADYKYLETFFNDTLGMNLELINKTNMKPIFLSTLVTQIGDMSQTESYELTLTAWAKMQDKQVKGLETIEFQMAIFDSIPYSKQAEMLMEAVKNNKEAKKELDELYKYYKSNELSKLVHLSNESSSDLMEFEDILLIKRNNSWISLIEKYAIEKPSFFAVGALHLPGEKGVINLLRKRGYKVEPVKK
jgi:uncharacterized protein